MTAETLWDRHDVGSESILYIVDIRTDSGKLCIDLDPTREEHDRTNIAKSRLFEREGRSGLLRLLGPRLTEQDSYLGLGLSLLL